MRVMETQRNAMGHARNVAEACRGVEYAEVANRFRWYQLLLHLKQKVAHVLGTSSSMV